MSNNKKTRVIGLTGMSGAGKSTACKLFREAGFKIVDCDRICREIVEKGKPCLEEIISAFGEQILTEEGELNRRLLGRIIFSDSEKRILLNGIMYPYVSYSVINQIIFSDKDFTVLDAPTLFESGMETVCDCTVSVASSRDILISRIMSRDNVSREEAENRLDSQHDIEFYRDRTDILLMNDGSLEEFSEEIRKTIELIKESR